MAISNFARELLKHGLANRKAADDIADIVDAGSGTMASSSKRWLLFATGNRKATDLLETGINAGTAINDFAQRRLAIAIGDQGAADEIADELAA